MLHFELTDLPEGAYTLTLFDVQGRVAGRWSRVREAGHPSRSLSRSTRLAASGRGVYIVRLAHATAGELATAKVVLLK